MKKIRVYIILFLLSANILQSNAQDTAVIKVDDQGIALNLLFNLNIPSGYIMSPTLYYRSQFRPLNRPLHFFINPNMGFIKTPDAKRIDPKTGQIVEGVKKVGFGIAPMVSVGFPILYKAKYSIANVLKGTYFKSTGGGDITTYYIQQGKVPTHQALLAEIGYAKFPEYDAYGPSLFYGLRWYITQKGKIPANEENDYYKVKQVMSLYFQFYKRLNSDVIFKNIPEDNLRKTGYKFGVEYTKGGQFGMIISVGGCPGRRDAYGGTSFFLGYLDIGVYKVLCLAKSPI